MKAMLGVLILSLIGGFIFSLLRIPIPWMLGPIIVVMLVQFFYKEPLKWPGYLIDFGVVTVGTVIGVQFNTDLFGFMGSILFYMVMVNSILIGGSIGIASLTSKWAKVPMKAAVLGTIPGGLSQIVIFAEEEKVKEIGVISYFQVIRLLLVVVFVPFIVAGQVISKQPTDAKLSIGLLLLIVLAWGCSHLTQRLHLPVAFFITPIILLITLQLTTPITMPQVPAFVMNVAQLLIGAHIGLMLKPDMIKLPVRVLVGGILSAFALIVLTFASSFLMSFAMETTYATSFLSTAPGGLDQMVLLADAVHADASLVSMFQTFRLLFIFILVMPLMKLFYRWQNKNYRLQEESRVEKC
ncbi:Putative ammonia monooxygenase [Halalkalibacter krulwichiae]|uniref:Putative ammonia monooxygenase n=2 Tax=Halalkalibacter krulwichiae TaxID=199441 RepID=A0A1X9M8U7_9BACI|nr:Putative ammonia monooxygenase [Halalkalibacter krulwichiae]